jgi:hypothetical protein
MNATPVFLGALLVIGFACSFVAYRYMITSDEERFNREATIYKYGAFGPYLLFVVAIIMLARV